MKDGDTAKKSICINLLSDWNNQEKKIFFTEDKMYTGDVEQSKKCIYIVKYFVNVRYYLTLNTQLKSDKKKPNRNRKYKFFSPIALFTQILKKYY